MAAIVETNVTHSKRKGWNFPIASVPNSLLVKNIEVPPRPSGLALKEKLNNSKWVTSEMTSLCSMVTLRLWRADLTLGQMPHVQRVYVERDNVRGYICDENWTPQDAHVACRTLGYVQGVPRYVGDVT